MKKKHSLYKKALCIYSLVLLALIIALVAYVKICLVDYEKNDIDVYIKQSVSDLTTKDLNKAIDKDNLVLSKYEKFKSKSDMIKGIDKALENKSKISYKKSLRSNDKNPIYDIYYNENLILTITYKKIATKQKLGLLNYDVLEVKNVESNIEKGLYNVKVNIPNDYKLYINNNLITDKVESNNDILALISKYSNAKKMTNYDIEGLVTEPKVIVTDENNKKVNTEKQNDIIMVKNLYYTTNDSKEAYSKLVANIDVIDIAEKYSLFLTDDLKGGSHGFDTLSNYMIKGTNAYDMSYKWSHGIDITFTSIHTFKNPKFTNETLSNFILYNNDAFSVDAYLEKNMIVKGNDKKDIMNNKFTFVYYNGSWKLLDIGAAKEK